MNYVVILQSLQFDEVILDVEFNGCSIVVHNVKVYGDALLKSLFNQVDSVVEHLGAKAKFTAFIKNTNSHNITSFPLTIDTHPT